MVERPDKKDHGKPTQTEALVAIVAQLETLPERIAKATGKQVAPPTMSDTRSGIYRMLGIDPEKQRERQRFAEEMKHLRQTRVTANIALVIAGLTAFGTIATAVAMVLD